MERPLSPHAVPPGDTRVLLRHHSGTLEVSQCVTHEHVFYFGPMRPLEDQDAVLQSLAAQLNEGLQAYFRTHCAGEKLALLFSGGVDSVLLLLNLVAAGIPLKTVTVAFLPREADRAPSDWDVAAAAAVMRQLKASHAGLAAEEAYAYIQEGRYEADAQAIARSFAPADSTVMNVNIAAVLFYGTDFAVRRLGCTGVISGLGPDEYFSGYWRDRAVDSRKRVEESINAIHRRNVVRDCRVIAQAGARSAVFPYLSCGQVVWVVRAAYQHVPPGALRDKALIRRAIARFGVLDAAAAARPKKAAQFGSGASKVLTRRGYDLL